MRKNIFKQVLAIMSMLVISIYSIYYIQGNNKPRNNYSKLKSKTKIVKKHQNIKSVESKMMFTGNIFWGRYIRDWSMQSDLKYKYPFSRLNEFDRKSYDAWITGIECPITNKVNMTSAEQEAQLQFNCRPEFLPEAAKFFDVTTLANNHTDNQGADGFEEMKKHLKENGIQYFGHYDYKGNKETCRVIAMPSRYKQENGKTKKGFLPIAMCGYHGVFGIPTQDSINKIKNYSPYLPVFALPHMGAEYTTKPDEIKTRTYHSIIDSGADVVLADHPHWIQNTEAYKGKLIAYSMGNFMFDQQFNKEVTRSAAIRVNISAKNKDLAKWYQLGNYCKKQNGDCLKKIKDAGLEKIKYNFYFGVVGSNDANKITKPANESQTKEILERLNWDQTMMQLSPPYYPIKK